MRFLTNAVVISTLSLTCADYAPASRLDDSPTALATLQAKADQAQPRDRCFLYAEPVSQMADLASQQLNSGDSGQAPWLEGSAFQRDSLSGRSSTDT